MSDIFNSIRRWIQRPVKFFRKLERSETFCGQKTLERYGDFQEIGQWGVARQNDRGEWETIDTGKMLSETVKFVTKDGEIQLGRDWIPDRMPEGCYRDSADDGNDGDDDRFTKADWWKK